MSPIRTTRPLKKMSSRDRNPVGAQRRSTEADVENLNSSTNGPMGSKKTTVPAEKRSNTVVNNNKLDKDSRNEIKLSNG